jgi:three-Cys-motif partner protein
VPPKDKVIEARHQTTHKLELMEHYWGAWCTILAQTMGKFQFCPARLWLVDTHAGPGRHLSAIDPDGQVPGTPMLAALAARTAQRRFPGVEFRIRATDKNKDIAKELSRRLSGLRGSPPDGVDATVDPIDWVVAVPRIRDEIDLEDHPHGGRVGASKHTHRSLWFIDPFGVEGIDHAVIESFPAGSEVVVNLDIMAVLRLVGRAEGGDHAVEELLNTVYGGNDWRGIGTGSKAPLLLGESFAQSFPTRLWSIRRSHPLRPTGSQYRAMIHLTNTVTAERAFEKSVKAALARGTVIAGRKLSKTEKDRAALRLFALFRGVKLTTQEMRSMVPAWDLGQLRWICNAADQQGLGRWDAGSSTMDWFEERLPELTLHL